MSFERDSERRVTSISVFDRGASTRRQALSAGQIGKVGGLGGVRIGDVAGEPGTTRPAHHFAPPTLETVVPSRPADRGALHMALVELSEQDPLIGLRLDAAGQEIVLTIYGEVQKEVVQATLAGEYGVDTELRGSTTICVERPVGTGAAAELIGQSPNPFAATVGLRIDPAGPDTAIEYRLEVELGSLPLSFHEAVEEAVRETLSQGLRGWQVTGCSVTMRHSGFWSPVSTAADFRRLAPLVAMSALVRASTTVFEPVHASVSRCRWARWPRWLPSWPGCGLSGSGRGAGHVGDAAAVGGADPARGALEYAFARDAPVSGTIPT